MTDSMELQIQNQTLQAAIENHKQAYKSLADDYVKYQDETELVIDKMSQKIEELEQELHYEQELNNKMEQKLDDLSSKLMNKEEQNQSLTNQLKQSNINYSQLLKSSAQQLDDQVKIQQQIQQSTNASELEYLKIAYNTRVNEVGTLQTQLQQEKEIQEDLKKQIKTLKAQLENQQLEDDVLKLNEKIQHLQRTLYKSLTIIAALGCPFDVFNEDVIRDISAYFYKDEDNNNDYQPKLEKVEDLLLMGLKLLGLRPKVGEDDLKQIMMTSTSVQRTNNFVNPNQLAIKTSQTLLDRNYDTFRTLVRKCEILESRNAVLQTENIQQSDEITQLKSRLDVMQRQNQKLMEISKKEVAAHRQVYEIQQRRTERFSEVARQSQRQISNVRNACLQEVSQLADLNNEKKQILSFVDQIQEVLDSIESQQKEFSAIQTGNMIDLRSIADAMKELNLQPKIYDVKKILMEDYSIPQPANYIKMLESFFQHKMEELSVNRTINENMSKLLMLFVLLFNNQQNIEGSGKLKESNLFKPALDKMKWFAEQVIILAQNNNISQEDIINFYNIKDENGQLIDQHTATEQYVAELNNQLSNIQEIISTEATSQRYKFENLQDTYSQNKDLLKIINQADQMNTSKRYVSFLEVMINLLLNFMNTQSREIFQMADQMSKLNEQQIQQNELFKIQVKDFSNKLEDAVKQMFDLEQGHKEFTSYLSQTRQANQELTTKIPTIVENLNNYTETINQIMLTMENGLSNFEPDQLKRQVSTSQLVNSFTEKVIKSETKASAEEELIKQITSQLLDIQTNMTQFQDYVVQDREKLRSYIDAQKKQDLEKITQLREHFTQSEIKRKRQEDDAWLVRQRYTQLSMKYEETKDKLTKQIQELQFQLQKTREEKVSALRRNKEDLLTSFRKREEGLEEQIYLLKQSQMHASVLQSTMSSIISK